MGILRFWIKTAPNKTTYLCHTRNAYKTLRGRYQITATIVLSSIDESMLASMFTFCRISIRIYLKKAPC